jgi:hypothetical protein
LTFAIANESELRGAALYHLSSKGDNRNLAVDKRRYVRIRQEEQEAVLVIPSGLLCVYLRLSAAGV